jgi:hypothetical protein
MNVSTRVSHPHSIFWASEARDSILHIPVLLCNPRFASEVRHVYIFSNVRVTVSPIASTARRLSKMSSACHEREFARISKRVIALCERLLES